MDEGSFRKGKMNGEWAGYHANGYTKYKGHWTDNVKSGTWTYWNEKGIPEKTESYNLLGELHGFNVMYNPAGKPISEGNFKEGKPDGDWIYRYPYGATLRTCTYKDGQLHGELKQFGEKGKLIEVSHYKDGKKHGKEIRYDDKSGKELKRTYYKNGEKLKG
jgi:antitoxin component YwqK of YwqJK toxin-antitoxin module